MGVLLPAHGRHDLNGKRGDAVREDAELVLLGLAVEDFEAGQRYDTGLDVVVIGKVLGGFDADGDFGTGRDEGNLGTLNLLEDVTTLGGVLNSGALELRKVLAGEGNDAGRGLVGESDLVGSAGLVAVSGAPNHAVGESTEVGKSLNRLMGGAILSKTNGVVSGNPDEADVREGRKTDGTGGVGDEVEESTAIGDDGTVGRKTVHDGTHGMLTDTIADVTTSVVAEASRRVLEVDSTLPPGEVGAGKIGRSTNELGKDRLDLGEHNLGELSGRNSRVRGRVGGESLLPALGKLTLETADKVGVLSRELLAVLGKLLVPLSLSGGTGRGVPGVVVIDLLGHNEALLGIEAELLLELLDIVGLEGRAVDTVGALLLGTVANDGLELNERGLVGDGLALLNRGSHASNIIVAVLDGHDVPTVGLVPLDNILGEGAVGVTVNRDMVVVPDGNEVAELKVTSQRASLARDTLHQAAVAEEAVCVVVSNGEAGLVEDSSSVSLGHGKTDGVADTLAKGASGDLNAGGVLSLGVTRSLAADFLLRGIAHIRHMFELQDT